MTEEERKAGLAEILPRIKAARQNWERGQKLGEREVKIRRQVYEDLVNRAIADYAKPEVPGCRACAIISIEGGFGPPHNASQRCKSGKRNHCSCDTCF